MPHAADASPRSRRAWSECTSTVTSARWRIGPPTRTDLFLDVHRLDVDELADSEGRAFAPVAGLLHPTEGRPRVGADIVVDEAHPRFELLRRDPAATFHVAGEDAGPEAEFAVVGNPNRVAFVLRRDDGGDGTEHFLVMRGLPGPNIAEHRRRIPGAGLVRDVAAEQ